MPKFTEGDWIEDDSQIDTVIRSKRTGRTIATISRHRISKEEAKANARLIRAAKEMYELWNKLLNAHDCREGKLPYEFYRAAEELLAKIDGEAS